MLGFAGSFLRSLASRSGLLVILRARVRVGLRVLPRKLNDLTIWELSNWASCRSPSPVCDARYFIGSTLGHRRLTELESFAQVAVSFF